MAQDPLSASIKFPFEKSTSLCVLMLEATAVKGIEKSSYYISPKVPHFFKNFFSSHNTLETKRKSKSLKNIDFIEMSDPFLVLLHFPQPTRSSNNRSHTWSLKLKKISNPFSSKASITPIWATPLGATTT